MIHPTAIIDPAASIHENVEIGAYSVIGPEVVIDEGNWIGSHVVIKGPTKIGCDNKIFQFTSIGECTQALGEDPSKGSLEIGNRNTIREYATINRGSETHRGLTSIGDDNLLMAYIHVAHDCIIDNHVIFSNGVSIAGHVEVGEHAVLGGFTLVHQFVRIGGHSFSGMGTAINRDVPPYTTVAGNYASAYGINKEGLKRRNFSQETIRALHRAFMELIKSRKKREHAIETLEPLISKYKEVANFVEFIESSERGVVRVGR